MGFANRRGVLLAIGVLLEILRYTDFKNGKGIAGKNEPLTFYFISQNL